MNREKISNIGKLFYLFNFLALFKLFNIDIRAGVVSSILILSFLAISWRKISFNKNNVAFYLFLFINIISLQSYLFNDVDIKLYLAGWSYNIIPSLLYIVGYMYAKENNERAFFDILKSNIIFLSIGLFLFLTKFDFYTNYQISEGVPLYHRLESYMGSLVVGSVAVLSIPLYFYSLKNMKIGNKLFYLIIIILSLTLSMQRSAWVMGGAILVLCTVYFFKINNTLEVLLKYVIVFFTFILISTFILKRFVSDEFISHLIRRVDSFGGGMVSSRSNQWIEALITSLEHPFGIGVGSAGNKATIYGEGVVPDGNYFRILVETGFLGLLTFILINLQALFRSIKNNPYLSFVLLGFLFQAIGSNVFDFYYSSFIYWFILGYCVNYGKKGGTQGL
ncbi:O-antigen ligase family protein [Vagococcus fluvialis]|uniref:O-antigen ligase family protein n=1 Tax=Vagococcus fluvialis TaxID=2738 RepID=UPI003B215D36